jgi:hypothetical protein
MVFVQTRRTMSTATQVLPRMTEAASTTPDFREGDTPVEAVTRVVVVVIAKGICVKKARDQRAFFVALQRVYL